jgi:hypothetical protein
VAEREGGREGGRERCRTGAVEARLAGPDHGVEHLGGAVEVDHEIKVAIVDHHGNALQDDRQIEPVRVLEILRLERRIGLQCKKKTIIILILS